jgi:hypothetical protein
MKLNRTQQWLREQDEEAVIYDGLDGAVVGIGHRCGQPPVVVYDYDRIVKVLVERDLITPEEATEWIDHNIIGGWIGDRTPIVMQRMYRASRKQRVVNAEIARLRSALEKIAEMKDEPFCAEYAHDVLRRSVEP